MFYPQGMKNFRVYCLGLEDGVFRMYLGKIMNYIQDKVGTLLWRVLMV